jgi:uncharacterized protein
LALELLVLSPVQVVVIGEGAEARMLATMARARYAVNKQVLELKPEQVTKENLPPGLAETLPELKNGKAFAVVCKGNTCLPPTSDPEKLLEDLTTAL